MTYINNVTVQIAQENSMENSDPCVVQLLKQSSEVDDQVLQ